MKQWVRRTNHQSWGNGVESGYAKWSRKHPQRGILNGHTGRARQNRVQTKLEGKFKNASVQSEQYLRGADGKIFRDPITGKGRRVDHVVIENGRVRHVLETTSKTANKKAQIQKEWRIRRSGGHFIRDSITGQLIDISNVPTQIIRVK